MSEPSDIKNQFNFLSDSIRKNKKQKPVIQYDPKAIRRIITAIGNGFIPDFKIDMDNVKQIAYMVQYFFNDPKFEGDPGKGLLLIGPPGTGKTLLMVIFRELIDRYSGLGHATGEIIRGKEMDFMQWEKTIEQINSLKFTIAPTKKITEKYETQGHEGIMRYTKEGYCFDDLGEEDRTSKFYANECPVMSNVLTSRYNEFVYNGLITHATSNYPFVDSGKGTRYFQEAYGLRVEDRMYEMFNIVLFAGKSRRK